MFAHSNPAVRNPLVTSINLKVPRSAVGWTFYSQMLTLSRRTCRLFALIFFNLIFFGWFVSFLILHLTFKQSGMSCITFCSFTHISHGFFLSLIDKLILLLHSKLRTCNWTLLNLNIIKVANSSECVTMSSYNQNTFSQNVCAVDPCSQSTCYLWT